MIAKREVCQWFPGWGAWWLPALAAILLFALPWTNPSLAQRPRRIMPQQAEVPQTPQATTPDGSRGGFDWQGFVGGLLEDRFGGGQMPGPGNVPQQPYGPGPMYPGGMQGQPPRYVVPDYPRYSPPPRRVVTVPGNVVETRRVEPRPNEIVTPPPRVPRQFSPLEGRVWEVSVREARCYAMQFEKMINEALSEAVPRAGKGDPAAQQWQGYLDQIRELLAKNAPWREIEPIAREMMEKNRQTFSGEMLDRVQQAIRMMIVRDAFRMVGYAEPRSRGPAFRLDAVPRGVVWVVFDPTLAPGTALLVTEHVIVCGGGMEELYIVESSVAAALGLPVGTRPPEPDIGPEEAEVLRHSVILRNRENAPTGVNYVLNRRHPHTLPPGHEQKLPAEEKWIVEFDRGGGQGTARYSLAPGCYEFRIMDNRWDLVRLKFNVTIDNSEGKTDFVYLLNNEVVEVPAGKTRTHVDTDPIVVEFDRGTGPEEPARKNLNKNGTYKVAVNTDNNYLDLFSQDQEDTG